MGTISDKLNYLNETKQLMRQALINKGVDVSETDTFRSYVDKINEIKVDSSGTTTPEEEPKEDEEVTDQAGETGNEQDINS